MARVRRLNCSVVLVVIFLIAAIYTVKIARIVDVSANCDGVDACVTEDAAAKFSPIIIGDQMLHTMWFVQITDLHISSFEDSERIEQLKEFCTENVFSIRPSVVLASGDLTDGRSQDPFGSAQQEVEWQIYRDVVRKSGVLEVTKWLDVRGNHDNFDVPAVDSEKNYFTKYSVQGKQHARSYAHHLVQGEDTYSFIAVNACLEPGPRRLFNFIGLLNEREMDVLVELSAESKRRRSNATIWFGHYPTSTILSPAPGLRHLMRSDYTYLCGHLHTLHGWVPHMYTRQKQGFLELELGDWKNSRLYRVAAIDHGLLSFVDIRHGVWPIVLITNPKNALFVLADREPIFRISLSTHIRLLVFSTVNVTSVDISLDDGPLQSCVRVGGGPLYVLPWRPLDFASRIHRIRATAKDVLGRETVVVQSFSLDGSQTSFDLVARFFLMSNLVTVLQVELGLSVCIAILPLCYVRLMHHYVMVGKLARPRYTNAISHYIMHYLWLVASIDQVFYPLIIMTIYVPLGPWFAGNVLSGHMGIVFARGMFIINPVEGIKFLTGGISFAFAVFHMWFFNMALMGLLALTLDNRYHQLTTSKAERSMFTPSIKCVSLVLALGMGFFFCLSAYFVYATYLAYGLMATVLNPVRTWGFIAALFLWRWARQAPASVFHTVSVVFPPHRHVVLKE